MYGLIALLDGKTEKLINNIWKELKEKSISFYAYEIEDRRPHITLASYKNINKTHFIEQMDETYNDVSTIDISFNAIGSFLNSGTLYFSPTITKDLIDLHTKHHKHFEQFNDDPNSLYLPNKWIPHCTIANRLPLEKLTEAFSYCSTRVGSVCGKIVEIALIEVSDKRKAPIIYSKELKIENCC